MSGGDGPTRAGVSESLDALGQTIGSIIVRAADGWTILEPGPEGYILTSHGPDQLPSWEPPA